MSENINNVNKNDIINSKIETSTVSQISNKEIQNNNIIENMNNNNKTDNSTTKTEEEKNKKCICKKIYCCVSLTVLSPLIILGLIYFFSAIFNKKKIIINKQIEGNYVIRYLEIKKTSYHYDLEGLNETQIIENKNNTVLTDFIVATNKINKNFFFNNKDYLYESFLLIINISLINGTNSFFLGGINIYDDSKKIQDLISINNNLLSNISSNKTENKENKENNIPFSQFYFYDNGTIDKIYLPININKYYKSAILDLIEKVTPRLSESLYNDENNNEKNRKKLENGKEGIYLNYEKIIRNGKLSKLIIYENKIEKPKIINKNGFAFQNSVINSTLVRTFNHLGNMISVKMEGKALIKSDKLEEKKIMNKKRKNLRNIEEEDIERNIEINKSYSTIDINQFEIDVDSNLQIIKGNIEPKTLLKLNKMSNLINMEIDNSTLNKEQENETNTNIPNVNLFPINNTINNTYSVNDTKKLSNPKNNINYLYSYRTKYKILDMNFSGLYIGYDQFLYINNKNGLRENYINLVVGNINVNLSTISMYQYYDSGANNKSIKSIDQKFDLDYELSIFGHIVKLGFFLKCSVENGIDINIKEGEMYTKGNSEFDLDLEIGFGPEFLVFSFGGSIIGHLAKIKSFIEANTLLNTKMDKTLFKFNKNMNTESLDLKIIFLSIDLVATEKEYSETINLIKGFTDYQNFSYYY